MASRRFRFRFAAHEMADILLQLRDEMAKQNVVGFRHDSAEGERITLTVRPIPINRIRTLKKRNVA